MHIVTGIDLVHIPTFVRRTSSNELALSHVFLDEELKTLESDESRAGAFALKEAVAKALGMGPGRWHDIQVYRDESGKRLVQVVGDTSESHDVSVAHHEEYAIAIAVFMYAS